MSFYVKGKAKNAWICSYPYAPLFHFKIFITPDSLRLNDVFNHSKIYSIGEHITYLGSLNFTESGTKYNYETKVQIMDIEA